MKKWLQISVLLPLAGCSTASESGRDNQQLTTAPVAAAPLPRLYWALDSVTQRTRTAVPGLAHYQVTVVTRCLNDSAVINRVLLDDGPALDVSHNYESEIFITRQGKVWQQVRLTKEIFRQQAEVQKMGPLTELFLSRTEFLRYQAPNFYFTTRIGVPDSDIYAQSEVAFAPGSGLRVVQLQTDAGVE